MAWFLKIPSSFGRFCLDGDFTDWKEEREEYFNTVLSEAERKEFGGFSRNYVAYVSGKFTNEDGDILPHEWPSEYKTERTYTSIGSYFMMKNGLTGVDERLKNIIEGLEPGIHQFNPIQLVKRNGKAYDGKHYVIVTRTFIDSFDPEKSDPESWSFSRLTGKYRTMGADDGVCGIALRKAVFGNRHIWGEKMIQGDQRIISNELRDAMADADLLIPKLYKMKVV